LASAPKRLQPEPLHLIAEPPHARVVTRDGIVVQMPLQHLKRLQPEPVHLIAEPPHARVITRDGIVVQMHLQHLTSGLRFAWRRARRL
jgi:hypothetical protein